MRYIGDGSPSSVEEAEDLASDVLDVTEDDITAVRARVGENSSQLDNINAIAQFAEYHLTILAEQIITLPISGIRCCRAEYSRYGRSACDTESDIEAKDLARLQTEARELLTIQLYAVHSKRQEGQMKVQVLDY